MKISLLLTLALMTTSCFKTAEEIKRENQLYAQVDTSSKIIASLTSELSEVKSRMALTSGQLEEIDHKQKVSTEKQSSTLAETFTQLQEQVKVLTLENQQNKTQILSLQKEIHDQRKYLKRVTGALTTITGPTKDSSSDKLSEAHKAFEKNKQKTAKKLYLEVLSESKINAAQRNHVYFNLGLMNYWNKKYNDALVYFSKIYTKYPKSSLAPRSLLYIGRSFKKSGKVDEANASFAEVIKNYPKTGSAKRAKKEMK